MQFDTSCRMCPPPSTFSDTKGPSEHPTFLYSRKLLPVLSRSRLSRPSFSRAIRRLPRPFSAPWSAALRAQQPARAVMRSEKLSGAADAFSRATGVAVGRPRSGPRSSHRITVFGLLMKPSDEPGFLKITGFFVCLFVCFFKDAVWASVCVCVGGGGGVYEFARARVCVCVCVCVCVLFVLRLFVSLGCWGGFFVVVVVCFCLHLLTMHEQITTPPLQT